MKLSAITKIPFEALVLFIALATLAGCVSVPPAIPMATKEQDAIAKKFAPPPPGKAGLYVFHGSPKWFDGAKYSLPISVDNTLIGTPWSDSYFYRVISVGAHTLSAKSEFGDNTVSFQAEAGKNYFARHFSKLGQFGAAADVEMVGEEEGKKGVLECDLAQ